MQPILFLFVALNPLNSDFNERFPNLDPNTLKIAARNSLAKLISEDHSMYLTNELLISLVSVGIQHHHLSFPSPVNILLLAHITPQNFLSPPP